MFQQPSTIFSHYLKQLSKILDKIEQHQVNMNGADNKNDYDILQARLTDDMLPLIAQVRITANFSLRGCCPLANKELVSFDNDVDTFSGLKQQLSETINYLETLPSIDMLYTSDQTIAEKAGFAELSLSHSEFINGYIIPNFFFHLNMVYAIARKKNIPLSKQDYDGYHQYPSGFSWEK